MQTRTNEKNSSSAYICTMLVHSIYDISKKKKCLPCIHNKYIRFHANIVPQCACVYIVFFVWCSYSPCLFSSPFLSGVAAWSAVFCIVYIVCERQHNNIPTGTSLSRGFFYVLFSRVATVFVVISFVYYCGTLHLACSTFFITIYTISMWLRMRVCTHTLSTINDQLRYGQQQRHNNCRCRSLKYIYSNSI